MRQAIISTPENPNYSGTTFGVKFELGQAVIFEGMNNRYGYTFDELLDKFKRELPGYEIKERVLTEAQFAAVLPDGKRNKVKE